MKKLVAMFLAVIAAYLGIEQFDAGSQNRPPHAARDDIAGNDGQELRSGQQLRGSGTVIRVLPDDNEGSRHQRFILRLDSGRTLLIAHNIDLAARIDSLEVGDVVSFNGEYEWNERGGVIHWTHHDPKGWHEDGWLEHEGRRYQ